MESLPTEVYWKRLTHYCEDLDHCLTHGPVQGYTMPSAVYGYYRCPEYWHIHRRDRSLYYRTLVEATGNGGYRTQDLLNHLTSRKAYGRVDPIIIGVN